MPLGNNGFDLYGDAATQAANTWGVNPAIFAGLIDTESSWNPHASPGTTSAYGLTQLTRGTAASLGVNRFNPIDNLNGGAKYLSQLLGQFGGDYHKALGAYYEGAGGFRKDGGASGGLAYANKVLSKAQGYLQKGESLLGIKGSTISAAANAVLPGSGAVLDGLGITSDCGWICQLQNWIKDSGFLERIALAILALIILAAAFALMRGQSLSQTLNIKKG